LPAWPAPTIRARRTPTPEAQTISRYRWIPKRIPATKRMSSPRKTTRSGRLKLKVLQKERRPTSRIVPSATATTTASASSIIERSRRIW
jgi:hypothetical protein